MKNIVMKKGFLFLIVLLMLTMAVGCSPNSADSENSSMTKEEAYAIYYDTIEKFVPELMTEPQECDVDIQIRDEVTFLTEHFVRNTTVKINAQNVDGKLQYYLLNKFPEANKMNLYCIDDDKFYSISCGLNEKGNLKEQNAAHISSFIFPYLNTPLFKQEAIMSFASEKNGTDVKMTFVIDGSKMEYGYPQRVMKEINPSLNDKLDNINLVLTIDKDGVPKTMSAEISMSLFNDAGGLHAKKTLNMDYVFKKFDNVDFDLQDVISQYTVATSS